MDKDDKDYINRKKVKDHCHDTGKFRGAAHSKCNLNYKVQKEIPIIIHNVTYDTHFLINQLAMEFKGELNCIGDIMEKNITFSVPIKKECDNNKTITCKLKFIDSFRFMPTSLSELVDNASGIFNSIECKSCIEKILPPKKAFYSELNLKDITYKDYANAQKVWEVFGIRNLGEYHDLYVQTDTLLLADIYENVRTMCLKIYELDPVHFVSAPGLAWPACLKKTGVKLELITDYDMILMIEKGIRGGICQATHRYAKANNKYMKKYAKNIESSYIEYLDANNLYEWAISQKLPMNGFK